MKKLKKYFKNKKQGVVIALIVAVIIIAAIYRFSASPPAPGVAVAPLPVAAICANSNAALGANAMYTKGTVTSTDSGGNTQVLTDECADISHLVEYVCYESPVGSGHYASGRTIVVCTHGCSGGVCRK
jgi:hypothetical protein